MKRAKTINTRDSLLCGALVALLQVGCYVAAPPPPPSQPPPTYQTSQPPGTVMTPPPAGAACVAWRQTGGCAATGRREPSNDKACQAEIQPGWSGFCECVGGVVGADCGHPRNSCDSVCRQAFWSEAGPPPPPPTGAGCLAWRQTGGCSATGRREPNNDKDCQIQIQPGASGYCECEGGVTNGADCGHPQLSCALACRIGGWRR